MLYAIPVFFLLIGIELIIEKLQNNQLYRFNDAYSNISCEYGKLLVYLQKCDAFSILLHIYKLSSFRYT